MAIAPAHPRGAPIAGRRARPPRAAPTPGFPPAFVDFMMRHWRRPAGTLPPRVRGLQFFRDRRRRLAEHFRGDVLVIPTGHERVRANDTNYRFRPGSDFFYLTGNMEPDCVLVIGPKAVVGAAGEALFVHDNPGRTNPSFFTDRERGELWVGPRLGVRASGHRFGVGSCRPLTELQPLLKSLRANKTLRVRTVAALSPAVDRLFATRGRRGGGDGDGPADLAGHLGEMRLIKDAHEVRSLVRACQSSVRGFEDVIAALPGLQSERQVEGLFNLRARREGYDVGYNTIAAAGHHACTLHWTHNDGGLDPRQLLLLDAGVEGRDLYTADITRTLPIGGRFSAPQRQVYDLVLRAHAAALAEVRPGCDFMAPNAAAMRVLAAGLVEWGILRMPLEEVLDPAHGFHRRYTLHNVSHMLGLDVHDCAQARQKTYRYGALAAGMVLTIEPGLYFQRDDLTVPPRLRGIGVRIEDDVLVTRGGCRVLSDLPRDADRVEQWMAQIAGRFRRRPRAPARP